jgi:hypothetical protein
VAAEARMKSGAMPRTCAAACLAVLLALLPGCASQGAPAGGPPDTDPPSVVASVPASGDLNVREGKMTVEFSEYVDRRSFQESAFLSPSAGALTYDWDGSSVEITTAETLRSNTTYILTVGTDMKDTRNNKLEHSFTLSFSSGAVIDSCTVAGFVDDPEPSGVMIYAYDVSAGRGDTLDPGSVRPDYLTQTGKDGTFLLRNLREGEYRVMAVRDAFKNLLYNIQADRYGMAVSDVRLGGVSRGIEGIGFRLTAEDTARPFVSGAKAQRNSSVDLRFNEAVAVPGGGAAIAITDTLTGAELRVLGIAPADTSGREFVVTTAPHDSGKTYRLTVGGFTDLVGNPADSSGRTALFSGGAGADTLPPVLTMNVARDSAAGFLPLDTLRLDFNEPVDTGAFAGGFSLLGGGGAAIPGALRWRGAMSATFVPDTPFIPGAWYALNVRLDSVRSRTGRRGPDSLFVRRFRIAEGRMLAGIRGKVRVGVNSGAAVPGETIVVEARNISGAGGALRVRADETGGFSFEPLPEGRYVLSAYVDRNANGSYDCGRPHPVFFAEPFGLLPDTLKLRPRWPIDGVRIEVGK